MKRIALLGLLLSIVVLGIYSRPAAAADLTRAEATKLLGHMGLENIVIAGIVNGIISNGVDAPRAGSSHVATVFLYSEMNGKPANRTQIFFHDNEIGWFYQEINYDTKTVRLWTTSGYKELKPPSAK